MAHEHLVKWGKEAFERGFSLTRIEDYLNKRGLKQEEALKALHEITSFEHKLHEDAENVRGVLISIPVLILLFIFGLISLYFAGIIEGR